MPQFASQQFEEMSATRGRIPIVIRSGDQTTLAAVTGTAITATTIFTNTNATEADGAMYQLVAFLRVNVVDGSASITQDIKIVFTEGASARTLVLPMINEAGAITVAPGVSALGTFNGTAVIKCDSNTVVQFSSATTGATPGQDGAFDIEIRFTRLS